ncbi:MAG: DEAD/DEAH box helicase [Paraglaciecola sp.]|uniref:DEAD/DEAH box helicase n=1 Tax=Paraglaciecola sp. TaxID=1920173 RepID=UPI00273E0946|nr:DEAD/DEAH box helicase [Paraglaciecola sp.]MDP5032117.1 DEAD/DEAH box helicase [Paraglaciecola sp.]MDP5131813.1 DEAD/DEAH box helicase [Paraglaciecola sp.]
MLFSTLGLCEELLKAIAEQGYATPSAIQVSAIPAVLSGRDVMAAAQTGTGKTAAFVLPVLQGLMNKAPCDSKQVRVLIITPTRELAAQVALSVERYSQYLPVRSCAAFGGIRIDSQIEKLRSKVDVLTATPGRLLDLFDRQALDFTEIEVVVFDEADRMLELGFSKEIQRIHSLLPVVRQTLMFSATFSIAIKTLAKGMLNNPQLIELAGLNKTVDAVKQVIHPVDKSRKSELLIHLLKTHRWPQVLVFSRTKEGADRLVIQLEQAGITSAAIHANRSQHARTLVLDGFRNGTVKVLVATDIASRGIDISQLPCVINVDLPYVAEDYVHRIGRTGRAGASGIAISLFSDDETKQLVAIERAIGRKFSLERIPGFMPSKKAVLKGEEDEDEYGNFEADAKPRRQGRANARKNHRNR